MHLLFIAEKPTLSTFAVHTRMLLRATPQKRFEQTDAKDSIIKLDFDPAITASVVQIHAQENAGFCLAEIVVRGVPTIIGELSAFIKVSIWVDNLSAAMLTK